MWLLNNKQKLDLGITEEEELRNDEDLASQKFCCLGYSNVNMKFIINFQQFSTFVI